MARQTVVGEHLNSQGGDRPLDERCPERVNVGGGNLAARQQRAVVQLGKRGAALRFGFHFQHRPVDRQPAGQSRFPVGLSPAGVGIDHGDPLFGLFDFGQQCRHFLGLLLGGHLQRRLVGAVENGEQLVEFALRNRVVLVIVAAGAAQGQTKKRGAGRANAVDHGFHAKLLVVGPAFFVQHRVAMEPGCNALSDAGIVQHVAGQLLDRELVERQIAIQRLDDPIAILPDRATAVDRVAVGIGVTGQVEPMPPPTFAIMRGGEQSVDHPPIGVVAGVGQKPVDFLDRRRQSHQVETQAANERRLVGFRRRL